MVEFTEPKSFEEAHRRLGEHLGFLVGNVESEASPYPWWRADTICLESGIDARSLAKELRANVASESLNFGPDR